MTDDPKNDLRDDPSSKDYFDGLGGDLHFDDDGFVDGVWLHRNARVGDEDIARLQGFPRLAMLFLEDTRISDAGVRHLPSCSTLHEVILANTNVTDRAIDDLLRLPLLKILNLDDTAVSSAGAERLCALKNLEILGLMRCDVSEECVETLGHELPDCNIQK